MQVRRTAVRNVPPDSDGRLAAEATGSPAAPGAPSRRVARHPARPSGGRAQRRDRAGAAGAAGAARARRAQRAAGLRSTACCSAVRSWFLLRHTVVLCALVVVLAATIGVAAAWCTERTRLPGRRVWTVLLVLPVAIPDFVVGYAWHSIAPTLNPLLAATLVMTLGTYPLVYLPVAAALRRADPAMEETAHSLGVGAWRTFVRVTLPLMRTAVLGGCVLVVLTVLSEYGAFEILRYQTFTTEIFTEFQFDSAGRAAPVGPAGAARPAGARRRRAACRGAHRRARSTARAVRAADSGVAAPPVLVGARRPGRARRRRADRHARLLDVQSQHTTLPAAATLGAATANTLGYSAARGRRSRSSLALPVAMMTFRRSSRRARRARAQHLRHPGPARRGDRAEPRVLRHALRVRRSTRPACCWSSPTRSCTSRSRWSASRPRSPRRRRGWPTSAQSLGRGPVGRLPPRDAAAARARSAGRVLPGVPDRRHRADGDAGARADRRADPRDPVLGLPERGRLRRGRALRAGDHRDGRRARGAAGAVVRPRAPHARRSAA